MRLSCHSGEGGREGGSEGGRERESNKETEAWLCSGMYLVVEQPAGRPPTFSLPLPKVFSIYS